MEQKNEQEKTEVMLGVELNKELNVDDYIQNVQSNLDDFLYTTLAYPYRGSYRYNPEEVDTDATYYNVCNYYSGHGNLIYIYGNLRAVRPICNKENNDHIDVNFVFDCGNFDKNAVFAERESQKYTNFGFVSHWHRDHVSFYGKLFDYCYKVNKNFKIIAPKVGDKHKINKDVCYKFIKECMKKKAIIFVEDKEEYKNAPVFKHHGFELYRVASESNIDNDCLILLLNNILLPGDCNAFPNVLNKKLKYVDSFVAPHHGLSKTISFSDDKFRMSIFSLDDKDFEKDTNKLKDYVMNNIGVVVLNKLIEDPNTKEEKNTEVINGENLIFIEDVKDFKKDRALLYLSKYSSYMGDKQDLTVSEIKNKIWEAFDMNVGGKSDMVRIKSKSYSELKF